MTAPVPATTAFGGWAGTWFLGQLLGSVALLSAGVQSGESPPTWLVGVAAACTWVPFVVLLQRLALTHGSGDLRADYSLRWRTVDLLGLPIGAAAQVVIGLVVYAPLRAAWPGTFSQERMEQNVGKLTGQATAGWAVLLVVIVVAGAPLIEELVYRGLLQGAAIRRAGPRLAVPAVAVLFALIHFRPVEYPGLVVFGLVVGLSAWRTGRLGMAVLTHMAFNATGLALAWR